ncbi:MAG TPA: hypothetical protein PK961_06135 [bacterium]|nr:hypothetical protein [bacterium]
MEQKPKTFQYGELIVIAVTFVLFIMALFVKGLTKELLLEAGVFLVSLKLILNSRKNARYSQRILGELEEIKNRIGE